MAPLNLSSTDQQLWDTLEVEREVDVLFQHMGDGERAVVEEPGMSVQVQPWDVRVSVSLRHPDPELVLLRAVQALVACEPALLRRLDLLELPYFEPPRSSDTHRRVAAQCLVVSPDDEDDEPYFTMTVPGMTHAREGWRRLDLANLEHELAHLNGAVETVWHMGPPTHLQDAWTRARREDAAYQADLPSLWIHDHMQKVGGALRTFPLGSPWASSYAASRHGEQGRNADDWAESVSHWLLDRREGALWRGVGPYAGQELRFAEQWPARALLIESWLAAMSSRMFDPQEEAHPQQAEAT